MLRLASPNRSSRRSNRPLQLEHRGDCPRRAGLDERSPNSGCQSAAHGRDCRYPVGHRRAAHLSKSGRSHGVRLAGHRRALSRTGDPNRQCDCHRRSGQEEPLRHADHRRHHEHGSHGAGGGPDCRAGGGDVCRHGGWSLPRRQRGSTSDVVGTEWSTCPIRIARSTTTVSTTAILALGSFVESELRAQVMTKRRAKSTHERNKHPRNLVLDRQPGIVRSRPGQGRGALERDRGASRRQATSPSGVEAHAQGARCHPRCAWSQRVTSMRRRDHLDAHVFAGEDVDPWSDAS